MGALPWPSPEKCASGDSTASVFCHGGKNREILFLVAEAKAEVSEIVKLTGVSVIEIGRVTELYLSGIAAIRECSDCSRRFASLSFSDVKCPVCAFDFDGDDE